MREQLRRAHELEAVGRLAAGIAHDFNNLLSAMMTFTSLVHDTLEEGDERKDDLAQVLIAGKRAIALTRQLLALARTEPSAPRPIDLNELLTALDGLCQRLVGEQIAVDTHFAPDLWQVQIDPGHFEQIVTHLLVNARDGSPSPGTIAIETRNDHDARLGDCVLCRISSHGVGISPGNRKISDTFVLEKEPTKSGSIGLATVYDLLLQAKGTIEIDRDPRRGTRFELRFARADAAPRTPRITNFPERPSGTAPGRTILLAEDEPVVRKSVSRMLRRGGYRLFEACTGAEALVLFAEHKREIDLALLDVVMPELSGPETAIRLHAESPSLKILFMSGYPRDLFEANVEAKNLGPMIQKPMTEATLLSAIQSAFAEDVPLARDTGPS
jgi:two-component system cell cycle sensor histidine kinase/response regulator CckA